MGRKLLAFLLALVCATMSICAFAGCNPKPSIEANTDPSSTTNDDPAGSAQPQLPIKDMRRIKIIKADAKTMDKFTKCVADIYKQVSLMIMKNQTISKQRDLLLPRLMSGKLEV